MQKKAIKVTVTATDIRRGVEGDAQFCAVARAVKRAVKAKHVRVLPGDGENSIRWVNGGRQRARMPKKISGFIGRFDEKMKVKPISFMLKPENDPGYPLEE